MIRTLLSRFRREPKPPTMKQGVAILRSAIDGTVQSGLKGFVLGVLREDGSPDAESVIAVNGAFSEGLAKVLDLLLADPETKSMALTGIVTALQKNGSARIVRVPAAVADDDCDCVFCTMRREMQPRQETTMKPH